LKDLISNEEKYSNEYIDNQLMTDILE